MRNDFEVLLEKLAQIPTPAELSNSLRGASEIGYSADLAPFHGVRSKFKTVKPGLATSIGREGSRFLGRAGKGIDWMFSSLKGNAIMGGIGATLGALEALAPKASIKSAPGLRSPESFKFGALNQTTVEKRAMRSLKDVLVNKIRDAKMSKTASVRANLGVNVDNEDVKFFSKLASEYSSTEKTAGAAPTSWMNELAANAIPGLQVAGLGLLGGTMASGLYDKASEAYKRSAAYEQMFEEFPQLKEVPRETVDKYWGVLNDYAPKLTINPLVAGQFVENMLNYGVRGIDHNVASQLMEAENRGRSSSGASDLSKMIASLGTEGFRAGVGFLNNGGENS